MTVYYLGWHPGCWPGGREWGAVSDEGETVDSGDLVPMRRTLVWLLFSFRTEVNQDLVSDKHKVRQEGGRVQLGLLERWSWVSSVKYWKWILIFMKDIAKGEKVGDEKKQPEDRVYYYYCYYLYSKHAIVSHEYKHSSAGSWTRSWTHLKRWYWRFKPRSSLWGGVNANALSR